MPATATAALEQAMARIVPGSRLAYREEVHHPALLSPEVAEGVLWVEGDGTLVRAQSWPRAERTAIGTRFLSVQRGEDPVPNLVPIPAVLRPMVEMLRALASGSLAGLRAAYRLKFGAEGGGWRVALLPEDGMSETEPGAVRLFGCGAELQLLSVATGGGGERRLRVVLP